MEQAAATSAPVAKIVPHEITVHGDTRVDNYFWMREREDPDVLAYLEAENAYQSLHMEQTVGLQGKLYDEILSRIQEDDTSVPLRIDDWFYYIRTEKDKAYPIYCRKHGSVAAPENIILDANLLAAGQKYFRLGNAAQSPDHQLLAYSVDLEGDEIFTILVKDLLTGELLTEQIPNASYSLEWASDNRTLFYTTLDETLRPYRVFRHELGNPEDTLIFEETDQRFSIGLSKSRNREFLFLDIDSSLTSEVRFLRTSDPLGSFVPILAREQGIEYSAEHQGDWFYIRINQDAPGFRLMRTPVAAPSRANWTEIIPARDGITIEAVNGFANHLIVEERERGLENIRIARAEALDHFEPITFPEPVYTAGVGANAEYDTNILRFVYGSLTTPDSVYDYDMETRERVLMKRSPVLGGYEPSDYQSERLFAKSADGVEVPISLVYRKGLQRDGNNPLLLNGYGAYGISTDPSFSADRLCLLDRGFVIALAHIRGGGDLGKPWHDAGKLLLKKNTFFDFIACAEHLIATDFTSSGRLAIRGGSAGGLLMGAVANMRPDLFHLIIAKVPFVDALNTMLDPTLPLTVSEYEEWGNPENEEFYRYIRSYSPYDNIEPQRYPAILATTGLNDPRVSFWEPAKWVAKLRALRTDENPLLLKTIMSAGHFGPSGRYEGIRELAFDYAFLLHFGGFPKELLIPAPPRLR
jgi:oligopeptidase B